MSCASTAPSASTRNRNGHMDFDAVTTIPAALRRAAAEFADAEAVVDDHDRLTFAQLADRAETVARALVASGVGPGDRVAIWAPNSGRWIVASFGVYLA